MFQFSDDIDDDLLEDVLNISTNQIANVSTTSSVTNCSTSGVETVSVKNDSNITLGDFDEDDLILSAAFEDANNSFCESQKLSCNSPVLKNNTNLPKKLPSTQLSHSRDSGYLSSPTVTKHKSVNSFNSPSAVKYSKVQYERRFAGPAGLIPKKSQENSVTPVEILVPSKKQQIEVCETDNFFCDTNPSWRALLNDVNSNELLQRMKEFTITDINRLNLVKETFRKIPIFGAIIFNIDSSVSDPCVTLKDPTGEIMGTLDKDLWDQYNHLLSVGSALLLRQVSVLSLINSRKLYLNITTNNIVTIYTLPKGDTSPTITQVRTVSETDFLNETKTERCPKNSYSNSKERSNSDLLNLIKNSNNLDSPHVSSIPKTPSIKNCVPDGKSISAAASSLVVDANKSVSNMKLCESKANLIFNELEGLDADSLFDEF